MQSLQNSLYAATKAAVDDFVDKLVSAKLLTEKTAALAIWNSVGDELKIVDAPKKAKKPVVTPAKKPKEDGDLKKCQYVYVKGDKEGESCGAKVSDESDLSMFCKKHIAHEKKGEEKKPEKKVVKKPVTPTAPKKTGGKKKAELREAEAEVLAQMQEQAPVFSVKMNRFKLYEHEPTGFLFDRKTEEVYGKQRPDGTVAPLTIDDVETCKCLGFRFRLPERLQSREDKEDEEEIVDSEEEDEEDEEEDEDD